MKKHAAGLVVTTAAIAVAVLLSQPDSALRSASDGPRTASADNQKLPFVIVDKKMAKVFVFLPDGQLRGAAPALLGLSRGDDTVPGIGERKLATMSPDERTTPSGRFVAALGTNLQGKDILWIDYAAAISMHRVVTSNAKERRAQRLASPSPDDNRISYGCINVPVKFYERVLSPAFKQSNGIVYVLPDSKPMAQVFAAYHASLSAQAGRIASGPAK